MQWLSFLLPSTRLGVNSYHLKSMARKGVKIFMDSNEKQKGLVQRKKGTKKTAGERSKELLIHAYTHHNPSVEVLPLRDIYPVRTACRRRGRL